MFSGNAVGSIFSDELREKIIWNFYEAKEINLTKILNGSLLAPHAILTNWTPIEGSVIVNGFNQWGEVHQHTFDGDLTVEVPEPSTVFIFGIGFLIIVCYQYCSRQKLLMKQLKLSMAI